MSKEYFADFREYLDELEKRGKLHRWNRTVNKDTELMPLMRFISPVDPRWLSTMDAIEKVLTEDSLVYRYDTKGNPIDGLHGREGSFTACSFWFIECLARSSSHWGKWKYVH